MVDEAAPVEAVFPTAAGLWSPQVETDRPVELVRVWGATVVPPACWLRRAERLSPKAQPAAAVQVQRSWLLVE
jgi:hypothetical protein